MRGQRWSCSLFIASARICSAGTSSKSRGVLPSSTPGFPGHYHMFHRGIAKLGFGVEDVVGIVLTHAHSDHTGFAARVSREAGAPIFVHRQDARMAKRVLQLPWLTLFGNAWRPWGGKMLLHATLNGVFTCPRIRQIDTIADGQVVDIPGRPTVIHTPGHTPGHIALHVGSASTLFAGDAVLTRSLRTGRLQQPLAPEKPYNMDDQEATPFRSPSFAAWVTLRFFQGTVVRGREIL